MNILVTGGAGFIGSHLTRALLNQGHSVQVIDNLSTGRADALKDFESEPRLSFVIDSVENEACVLELAKTADRIYHLAAAVGVHLIIDKPLDSIETNVLGTETVLKVAAQTQTPTFIASSSEVYGKTLNLPFHEDHDLVLGSTSNTRWSYACSKAIDECLAFAYHREQGLPVVIGRIFNTTGPGQVSQYGMVLPNFVNQAMTGEPIRVFGDGNQSRCFCHIDDVVRALVDLMDEPDCMGEVFNIGSTHEVSIAELARLVKKLTGSESEIETIAYVDAYGPGFEDMQRRFPDIRKIEKFIGWRPELGLEELIQEVIDAPRMN